MFPSNKQNKKK